jgi:low affinity Fe/Cu permease
MGEIFHHFAQKVSNLVGSAWAFVFACILIIGWAVSGPYFNFSDTWELIINTLTTIITFLMVFVIQNTQNREVKNINLKLDELIRVTKQARNNFMDLEEMSDAELKKLEQGFYKLVKTAKSKQEEIM